MQNVWNWFKDSGKLWSLPLNLWVCNAIAS